MDTINKRIQPMTGWNVRADIFQEHFTLAGIFVPMPIH